MGELTDLVCLTAFNEASRAVENARRTYGKAAAALTACRAVLDRAVERASKEQSFGTIKALFNEEEAALAAYERAKAKLAQAEQRWCTVKAALAYERNLMMAGAFSGNRLN
jgi:hypothetical protein